MSQPLVIAHHLVWTGYGWWLPNDPRGSGSQTIRSDFLKDLGELHHGRKAIQPSGQTIRNFYAQAAQRLLHPLLPFDEAARDVIAAAIGNVIESRRYTCYACVVMPDHVHVLIRKHKHRAEEMMEAFKDASREHLAQNGCRAADHPVWGGGGWKVFLDHPDEVRRTIAYIERNPLPLRLPVQQWPFVTKYDDWPLHAGHSPNSPYVKALRAAGRYP